MFERSFLIGRLVLSAGLLVAAAVLPPSDIAVVMACTAAILAFMR